jgi:hypothetical protein
MKIKPPRSGAMGRRLLSSHREPIPAERPKVLSETEFNLRRRMMAVIEGTLRVAPPATPKFHRQWFIDEGWIERNDDRAYNAAIRGFTDHRGLFLYKGGDFSPFGIAGDLSVDLLDTMAAELDLAPETQVWLGLVPCSTEVWKGRELFGRLDDLRDHYS